MAHISVDKSFSKARQLIKRGEIQQAIAIYQHVLDNYPKNQRARQALQKISKIGAVDKVTHPPEEVTKTLTQALKAKRFQSVLAQAGDLIDNYPTSTHLWSVIGIASANIEDQDTAITAFKKVVALNPKLPEAQNNLGNAYKDKGELSLAVKHFRLAIALQSDFVQARHHLGQALIDLGKVDEAKAELEAVLEIRPDFGDVHSLLTSISKYKSDDKQVQLVERLLDQRHVSEVNKCQLHFTMAKMREDIGDIESAFHHYVTGGALKKKLLKYDQEMDSERFSNVKSAGAILRDIKLDTTPNQTGVRPIFIVGMPRSGTTLVEQILSQHSDVQAGGELDFLRRFGGALSIGKRQVTRETLLSCREAYVREVTRIADGRPFVTDKTPHNFFHVALIRKILPEASIVHVNRDPFATCWSNFTHYFTGDLGYSYDLADVVHHYHLFRDIMSCWKDIYGDNIVTLEYEALTVNQLDETRALLNALGLEWQDECLSPHKSTRVAKTASSQQVKEKIYTGSSQKWRRFEPFLKGAFDELVRYTKA